MATSDIRNPIQLARVVLDHSCKPLSLRRVPPNLLVGTGAAKFAFTHGIPNLPDSALISPAAQYRYDRWREELRLFEINAQIEAKDAEGERDSDQMNIDAEQKKIEDVPPHTEIANAAKLPSRGRLSLVKSIANILFNPHSRVLQVLKVRILCHSCLN